MSRRPPKNPRGAKKAGKQGLKKPAAKPVGKQRLQRWLAAAGFGSRRQCEELIEAGRVEVDGAIVTKLGTTVDPSVVKVRVDGVELKKQKLVYYAVNKPIGFLTTNADPQGRSRVIDLVPNSERVFPVGRLDLNSEGLILLTNDGDLAQQLSHPKFGVRKIYRVTVAGKVDGETMKQMRHGIYIAEGRASVEGARILKSRARSTELEIVLREGKNREIRRILARLGHKVQHLRRIAVGPLRLGDLPAGAYRPLTRTEIQKLKHAVDENSPGSPKRRESRSTKPGATSGKRADGPGQRRDKQGKTKRRPARGQRSEGVEMGRSPKRGAVIGADVESDESRSTRQSGKKQAAKQKRSSGKRSTKKRAASSRGRSAKKSKGKRTSAAGRRGSAAKTVKKKSSQKRRPSKKGRRSKD